VPAFKGAGEPLNCKAKGVKPDRVKLLVSIGRGATVIEFGERNLHGYVSQTFATIAAHHHFMVGSKINMVDNDFFIVGGMLGFEFGYCCHCSPDSS